MKWAPSFRSHPQHEAFRVLFGKNTIVFPLLPPKLKSLKNSLPLQPPSCFSLVSLCHNRLSQLFKVLELSRRNVCVPTLQTSSRMGNTASRDAMSPSQVSSPAPFDLVLVFSHSLLINPHATLPVRLQDGKSHLSQELVVAFSPGFLPNTSLSNLSSAGPSCCSKKFSLRCRLLFSDLLLVSFAFLLAVPAIPQSLSNQLLSPLAVSRSPHTGTFPSLHLDSSNETWACGKMGDHCEPQGSHPDREQPKARARFIIFEWKNFVFPFYPFSTLNLRAGLCLVSWSIPRA